jgi:hypothetical protein
MPSSAVNDAGNAILAAITRLAEASNPAAEPAATTAQADAAKSFAEAYTHLGFGRSAT